MCNSGHRNKHVCNLYVWVQLNFVFLGMNASLCAWTNELKFICVKLMYFADIGIYIVKWIGVNLLIVNMSGIIQSNHHNDYDIV